MVVSPVPNHATVAIAGGKGGCGKTTATLGLGAALVQRGCRPVAVDADRDVPDLHIRAGVDREPGLPALVGGRHPATVSQSCDRFPGVSVVAAGTDRVRAQQGLTVVAELSRPVLLDCPAGAGPDAAAPLAVADACIVVSSATQASRADGTKTLEMARSLGTEPIAAVERRTRRQGPSIKADPPFELPTVAVPDGDRKPLETRSVREAFRRLARHLYADPSRTEGATIHRRHDSHN